MTRACRTKADRALGARRRKAHRRRRKKMAVLAARVGRNAAKLERRGQVKSTPKPVPPPPPDDPELT